jgi:hypothetical protein
MRPVRAPALNSIRSANDVTAGSAAVAPASSLAWARARIEALVAVPAYPLLFALTVLLLKMEQSWSPLPVLIRPLVVVLLVTATIQVAVGLVVGRAIAAYFVSLLLLILVEPFAALLVLLIVVVPMAWRSAKARHIATTDWSALKLPMNVMAAVALAATVIGGLTNGWLFLVPATGSEASTVAAPADAPDIYLILLDGYPRTDALLHDVGMDNSAFLDDMSELGFDVARASRSNYTRTALTLASMFNGRAIDELLPDPPRDQAGQARALAKLINEATTLDVARSRGYEIVSLPSAVSWLSLYAADRVLQPPSMTEFELTLTEQGFIGRVAPQARREFFLQQHRERTLWTFDTLSQLPTAPSTRPRLVFAHVLMPHAPIAFGPAGEPVMVDGCIWTLCTVPYPIPDEFRTAYAGQVQYLDSLVELTAERIIDRSSRPPIVVFFSDHGSRLSGSFDSMFDNLLLSHTPGRSGVLPDGTTPVTMLPRLMNAYLGTHETLADDGSYWQQVGSFFPVAGPVLPVAGPVFQIGGPVQ